MNLGRFYALSQVEYSRNFIFKRNFPIHKIFERSCEIGLWRMTSSKISEVFGTRLTKKMKGKLYTTLEQIEHGHHVFRAYCRKRLSQAIREVSPPSCATNSVPTNLSDFGLKKV